jgi:hypothetical protein
LPPILAAWAEMPEQERTLALMVLVAARRLWPHPAPARLPRLRHFIQSENENDYGPALAACYALALIPGAEALELLELATQHPDPEVRLESLGA